MVAIWLNVGCAATQPPARDPTRCLHPGRASHKRSIGGSRRAAILPVTWSAVEVYFGITILLSLLSWGSLARQVRGKTLALREEAYTLAARAAGASDWWIITRHLLPNNASHIIVIATLAIPYMILGETALSFLGLGIRAPMVSWGVLLEEAQNVKFIVFNPWLVLPAVMVILAVLGFNFLGDGLRDAVDPYSK